MSASRSQTGSRLPLVYWRAVVPDSSALLQRVGATDVQAARSDVTLAQIAGPQLEQIAAREADPEILAQLSPDGSAVTEMRTLSSGAKASADWAQVQAANQLVVSESDFKIPQIRVKNLASSPVLLPAGTAFLGGAQNRMLLEPEVIPAGAERKLGVFCIEAGRWQEEQPRFRSIGRVPSLFLLRVLEAGAGRFAEHSHLASHHQDLQVYTWETVLAGLTLGDEVNPTMDLMAFARSIPREDNEGDDLARNQDLNMDPMNMWGLFHSDRESGLAGCALYPNASFAPDAIFALKADLAWRSNLLTNGRGAREYYRIFDESKHLAIRCLPDGNPLQDLRKKPVLFEFSDEDLKNSFRPPLQSPPPLAPLSFAQEPMIRDWPEMAGYLGECNVELRKVAALPGAKQSRPGTKSSPEIHSLRFVHPARSLLGTGLLIGGRPAYLEATAFRSFSN